jgi:platelet-activating factor acetylhydrolase
MWLATAVRSLITWYGSTIKVPVYDCVPLLAPSGESDRWPLAIFSHGLCGSRTTYSTVCADLASHGRVVIAMEHRDGTGPAVFPAGRTVQYIAPNEVVWPDEQAGKQGSHKSAIQFRKAQLDFRRREIYETLHAVRSIAAGKHVESGLKVLEGEGFDFARWNGSLNQENVELVGHSFGGATIVSC